jgi:hypothetical protein
MRPKHPRRDANSQAILDGCRALGMCVWDTSDLGGEILDAVVFWRGHALPIEIKAPGHEGDFTEGEVEGMRRLSSVGVFPLVVTDAYEVARAFETMLEGR